MNSSFVSLAHESEIGLSSIPASIPSWIVFCEISIVGSFWFPFSIGLLEVCQTDIESFVFIPPTSVPLLLYIYFVRIREVRTADKSYTFCYHLLDQLIVFKLWIVVNCIGPSCMRFIVSSLTDQQVCQHNPIYRPKSWTIIYHLLW